MAQPDEISHACTQSAYDGSTTHDDAGTQAAKQHFPRSYVGGVRKLKTAATRQAMLDVAAAVFERVGYEAATIRIIAKAAARSTGAIFSHWAGKAELYREIYGHDPISPEAGRALKVELDALRATLAKAA